MGKWTLDREGFVRNYMVSGPAVYEFSTSERDANQLRFEAKLRSVISDHRPVKEEEMKEITLGEKSRLGCPWKYSFDNSFVNVSSFYSLLCRTKFDVSFILEAEEDLETEAVCWSYCGVDLYCSGQAVGRIDHPVYKPITKQKLSLSLKKGENLIYLSCEHLGVRDTRNIAGVQILKHRDRITVRLADRSHEDEVWEAEQFLSRAVLTADALNFNRPAPEGSLYTYRHEEDDHALASKAAVWEELSGTDRLALKEGESMITVKVPCAGTELCRNFERTEQIKPVYLGSGLSYEENRDLVFMKIADIMSENRDEKYGFPIANFFARQYFGKKHPRDYEMMDEMLEMINERYDCADFLVCGLIRYLHEYEMEPAQKERAKQTLLNFRYWMDMDGLDGMCFWSENHALMFYSSAMLAGELYPEDYFTTARRSGKELADYGREKVLQWIADVEEYGFEEFLSAVYMCVTFAVLLNVVDYAKQEISKRAAAITDKLLSMLSLHTYKNGMIAPMGRIYRSVLYPFNQGAMSMLNLMNPKLPYAFGEGWVGFYTKSSYKLPEGMTELMEKDCECSYTTGNARICLEKNAGYCLTSVQSPREDFIRWENETLKEDVDISTNAYTKSFNERFHGTTCFEPGTYGYQQHMWYAALDGEAIVFVNHPGSTSENGDMRPGYWHGNGLMPAVLQKHGMIGSIYRIGEDHPIHYTHLYCPECRFEHFEKEGNWIFVQKDQGYLGIWCSEKTEAFNGMNFNCEQRAYGDDMAWFVCAGRKEEYADPEAFKAYARSLDPVYCRTCGTLKAKDFELVYRAGNDRTQYL